MQKLCDWAISRDISMLALFSKCVTSALICMQKIKIKWERAKEAGRELYMLSLCMNKVMLTPHYTHYSTAAPLTQCLLSEVYFTLTCQDHLSKQSSPSTSGGGSDSALGNGNWQRLAWQTPSLTQSLIWARVLIIDPFSTLVPLFLVSHHSFVCLVRVVYNIFTQHYHSKAV